MPIKTYLLALLGILGIYLFSLSQDAILFENHDPVSGWGVLQVGWLGALSGNMAWYANLLFVASVFLNLARKPFIGWIISLFSVLIALTSPNTKSWAFNFSGVSTKVSGLGPAYETWMLSLCLHLAVTLLCTAFWAITYKVQVKN